MSEQIQVISQAETLEALTKSEIDLQVATAKAYPRNINDALTDIVEIATIDPETAASCFYCLKRGNSEISGLSVRMAEIIAGAWGNLRIASRVIGNDGRTITAQSVCIDLQRNVAVSTEVKRSILDRNGRTYSEDMQVVTGNAACSIAFRNAVLKVVPAAVTKQAIERVKREALNLDRKEIERMRSGVLAWYAAAGVDEPTLLEYMEIESRDELDAERLFELRGLAEAINERTTTPKEAIFDVIKERRDIEKAQEKAETSADKIAQAIAKNNIKTRK